MKTKFLALAALVLMPLAANAWASKHASQELVNDLQNTQMCLSTEMSVCYDLQHFDQNEQYLQGEISQVRIRESQIAFSAQSRGDKKLFVKLLDLDVAALKSDRKYLRVLFKSTMSDSLKHDIAAQLKFVNAAIGDRDDVANTRPAYKAVR